MCALGRVTGEGCRTKGGQSTEAAPAEELVVVPDADGPNTFIVEAEDPVKGPVDEKPSESCMAPSITSSEDNTAYRPSPPQTQSRQDRFALRDDLPAAFVRRRC